MCADQTNDNTKQREETLFRNITPYGKGVKINNWNEDLFFLEHTQNEIREKAKLGELLVQKLRRMLHNVLKSVQLSPTSDFMTFGSALQIKSPNMPAEIRAKNGQFSKYGLVIAGVITAPQIENIEHFVSGCPLTVSPDLEPCVRNTFVLESGRPAQEGRPVHYGEDVYIRIYDSLHSVPLYIRCAPASIGSTKGPNDHLYLELAAGKSSLARFHILHWDPKMRFETDGSPVPDNINLLIQHVTTGQNLTVEFVWSETFFGPECGIACHTYRDTHKMETAENFWTFVRDQPPDLTDTMKSIKN